MHNFLVDYQEGGQHRHECHQILGPTEEKACEFLLRHLLERSITPTLITAIRGRFTLDELCQIAASSPAEAMSYDMTFYMEACE